MAFGKYVGWKGVTYRGGGPMLTFLLHRITALGIILFVGLHVLASFVMQQLVAGDIGTAINIIYKSLVVPGFCSLLRDLPFVEWLAHHNPGPLP